jgi:hypothetical protein
MSELVSEATNLPAVTTDTTVVSDAANITRRCGGARMHREIVIRLAILTP